ncbi:S16 family serine protease [Shewanella salipaludis]|uniref:endopeptidase La n=1 Tax=Shewanella salipaludis TaxID=2723052 RepID=A0A972FR16_9GAMM|nr:S16 family serine protease [Shewanella salipaludis]NMH64181.1 AAA family ATPase [Shewanella salipaludis]
MTSIQIPTSSLAPQFHLPPLSQPNPGLSSLLLGQERIVDAFSLLTQVNGQQLYIADFPGIERQMTIAALVKQQGVLPAQYLVAAKADDQGVKFIWQTDTPNEKQGIIAEQRLPYLYLSGHIRRADLLGRITRTDKASQYQAGALAKCHYLFICAESLWKREPLWELLLQVLEEGQYKIGGELAPIPLNCKLVLVGPGQLYSQALAEDRLFQRHFPLLGEMAGEIDLTQHKETQYCQWLQTLAGSIDARLSQSSLLPLLRHSARLTEHQHRLSLSSADMLRLLAQAKAYSGKAQLDAAAISHALKQMHFRHNSSEVFSAQSFDDNFINLPTQGAIIGQVNGLTVIDSVDYSYGEPARITVSVHYGDGEVADIERKSELGGNIHTKGMMILSACLYRIFGRDAPLHLNANIVFEQSYQEIDGDSASLAEYCCLMSAIAEQPIAQSFGITGALDQFGNVQAIGGVNEKIEGFFSLCQRRGLTGEQGVIIPKANVLQLNLDPNIISAVENGLFHIHAITHMDQAVELLMNMPAGVPDEDNDFHHETLYGLVQARLDKLAGHLDEEPGLFSRLLTKLKFFGG